MKDLALLWTVLLAFPLSPLTLSSTPSPAAYLQGEARSGPVVTIQNLSFVPSTIRVGPGQTITFVNRDDFAHTATADDGSFDTGVLASGESAEVAFDEAGTFPYFCMPHPFMKATVIVEEKTRR